MITFGDIDRDAMMDMIYFRDGSIYVRHLLLSKLSIQVFYNQFEPLSSNNEYLCKQPVATSYFNDH